ERDVGADRVAAGCDPPAARASAAHGHRSTESTRTAAVSDIPRPALQPAARTDTGIADGVGHDQAIPHEQYQHGTDCRANQPGALIYSVPSERLAEIRCHERAGDAEQDGEDEPVRLIGAGCQMARDN